MRSDRLRLLSEILGFATAKSGLNNMYLSIIIPAYNEEKRIARTLKDIDEYLKTKTYDYEIIVVSDGSRDKTADIVKGLQAEVANLRLIDNKENHGKGFVVRQGLLDAKGDYRLFTDADNSTAIDQAEELLPYFEQGYDVVIGSRDIKGAVLANPQPWHRRMLGEIFNLFVQIIVGLWGIWDSQCGFKIITANAAQDILSRCKIDRWAFDPEILIIAKKLGYKIKEAPVVWANDIESKVKFKGMVKMGLDLLKIRWNLITKKYG
ncbi:MAG: Glycosyl transferase family 2 [Parcubacteria group bacterium GW2011_GWC2_39_11]|nr:MAG: Glycosyl transferase family 2 [Parcubacteria group bacterium GW2011_GWA2_38_27]KKQ96738.1 MAG: Glycosyl transferase family 2 [Parcubacteria group bacterium GW2011_GWC2_39_11]